jgi:hypothetical protein
MAQPNVRLLLAKGINITVRSLERYLATEANIFERQTTIAAFALAIEERLQKRVRELEIEVGLLKELLEDKEAKA